MEESINPVQKQKKNKKLIFKIVIIAYIVLSALFIVYVLWQNFKINYQEKSYNNGRKATIEQLISQSEDQSCAPFSVYNDEKQVQLINTACLQATSDQAQEETSN